MNAFNTCSSLGFKGFVAREVDAVGMNIGYGFVGGALFDMFCIVATRLPSRTEQSLVSLLY
jgi:hypothetical protein